MNLYQVEMMKVRLSTYLWAILGIFVSLLALGIMFLFLGRDVPEEGELFTSWNGLFALMTAIGFACFGVFSAVVAARVIVEEYCGKNAVVLLTYPIRRKLSLRVKCLLLISITTLSTFISNVLVMGGMYITSEIFAIEPELTVASLHKASIGEAGWYIVVLILLSSFFAGVLSSAVGVISAVAGWKKRSVMATIICSFIMICFVPNLIASSPNHFLLVLFLVSVLLSMAAYIAYQMLAKGLEKMEV